MMQSVRWMLFVFVAAGCGERIVYVYPDLGASPTDDLSVNDMSLAANDMSAIADLSTEADLAAASGEDLATSSSGDMALTIADASMEDGGAIGSPLTWSKSIVTTNCNPQVTNDCPAELWGVWGSSTANVYVVGQWGTIIQSVDNGAHWSAAMSEAGNIDGSLNGIWGWDATHIITVGNSSTAGGVVLRYAATNNAFVASPSGIATSLIAVWGSSANDVYAVGLSGVIIHSSNYGATWTSALASTTSATLRAVWGSGPQDVYVVGDGGLILHSSDGGAHWFPRNSGTSQMLTTIWGTNAGDIYIGGAAGTILHSADGGLSWQSQSTDPTTQVNGINGRQNAQVFAVGPVPMMAGTVIQGMILYSHVGATVWQPEPIGASEYLTGVWAAAGTTDVFAVGVGGTIWHGQ